jgi:hypothetical protein
MEEREAQGKKAENGIAGRREEKKCWKLGENIVSIELGRVRDRRECDKTGLQNTGAKIMLNIVKEESKKERSSIMQRSYCES